jgi:hypothetical protein
MEIKDMTNLELEKEQVAQRKTFRTFRQEEEYWRLKSRILWIKFGDQNTSFFHWHFRAHLSRNHIFKIGSTDGLIHKGFDQLKVAAETHF